jgi:hypothetical protein
VAPGGDDVTQVDEGRSRAAADRLLEVATGDLYRRNPFRIIGLATDAGSREVRQRRQTVLNAYAVGAGASVNDKRLPLPETPQLDEVRGAFDALERPDHRLVDELFWWWGEPGACECTKQVHELHDLAVEAHAKALDYEADEVDVTRGARFELWADAADAWMDAIEYDGFWEHVRHRVAKLADRRLDESTVDGLRRMMPRALLEPQVSMARASDASADLARLMDVWDLGGEIVDDARVAAAAPAYERIDRQVKEIQGLRDQELLDQAADRAINELPAAAILLETLVPYERFRRSAKLRNQIAITMNNAGFALTDPGKKQLRLTLLQNALEVAVEDEDIRIMTDNIEDHHARFTHATTPVSTGRPVVAQPVNYPANPAIDWTNLTEMIRSGRLQEASDLLWRARGSTTDPRRLTDIDAVLRNLAKAGAGKPPPPAPVAPRTWFMNMALCLGLIAGVVGLMAGQWGAPALVTAIVTVVLMPIPLTIPYITRYREVGAWFVLPGIVAFFFACLAVIWSFKFGPEQAVGCLIAFFLTLSGTSSMGKKLAGRLGLR